MPSPPTADSSLSLDRLIVIVWRRRWLSCLVAIACAALIFGLSFCITPLYEADAMLVVVKAHKALEFQPESDDRGTEFNLLNTQCELLQSYTVLKAVLDKAHLLEEVRYRTSGDPIALLSNRLRLATGKDAWVIDLSMRDERPKYAQAALTELIQTHLELEAKRAADRSRSAIAFLREQVENARKVLAKRREQEQELCAKNGILSTDPDRNHLALEFAAIDAAQVQLASDCAASATVLQAIYECDAISDPHARLNALLRVPEIRRDPLTSDRQEALFALQDKAVALEQRYKPEHPLLIEAREQILSAQSRLSAVAQSARAMLIENDQALNRRLKQSAVRMATVQADLAVYRQHLIELQFQAGETTSAEQLFQTVLSRLQEEEVTSHLGEQVVAIADDPHVLPSPVNLHRSLFALAGIVIGGFIATLLAVLIDSRDGRLRDVTTLQGLSEVPIRGFVPRFQKLPPLGKFNPDRPDLVQKHFDRALRQLTAQIRHSLIGKQPTRVILMTSPSRKDGRSNIAARLALGLTASDKRVLLIDGDLANPTAHLLLGEDNGPGLCEILQKENGQPLPTTYQRLDLLRAGKPSDISPLQNGDRLQELLKGYIATYDFIIIDSPPLSSPDALLFASFADEILVIARMGATTSAAFNAGINELHLFSGRVFGLIVNGEPGIAPVSE